MDRAVNLAKKDSNLMALRNFYILLSLTTGQFIGYGNSQSDLSREEARNRSLIGYAVLSTDLASAIKGAQTYLEQDRCAAQEAR